MTIWEKRCRRRAPLKASLELLEVCWKLRSPTGRMLECGIYVLEGGIYAVATGVEVRVAFSGDDVLRTQLTFELSTARELAAAWRQALLARGVFSELPPA